MTSTSNTFTAIAYNTRGHTGVQMLRIPVGAGTFQVSDSQGHPVAAQLLPITDRDRELSLLYLQYTELSNTSKVAQYTNQAVNVLTFIATIPPVGWSSYTVAKQAAAATAPVGNTKVGLLF